MKWIGFIFVMIASSGVGFSLVGEYDKRIRSLERVKEMMQYLSDLVMQEYVPLQEAYLRCSVRMEKPYMIFLQKVASQMNQFCGEDPAMIWSCNASLLRSQFKNKDYLKFCNCMEQTGFMDEKGQSQAFLNYVQDLNETISKLNEQKDDKCRLYKTLGITTGVFICILML